MFELVEFLRQTEATFEAMIKADEIYFRIFLTILQQEFAVTGSDLNFDRFFVTEFRCPLTDIALSFFIAEDERIKRF